MSEFQKLELEDKPYTEIGGTSKMDDITVKPADLVLVFGKPIESDGYKISGEYVFKHRTGAVLTMYDWKWTTLYDEDNPYTPTEFWALNKEMPFSVGARDLSYVDDFKNFIHTTIRNMKHTYNEGGIRGQSIEYNG